MLGNVYGDSISHTLTLTENPASGGDIFVGSFEIDDTFLVANAFIPFSDFNSFSITVNGITYNLADAVDSFNEGVQTDGFGVVILFEDNTGAGAVIGLAEFETITGKKLFLSSSGIGWVSDDNGDGNNDSQGGYSITAEPTGGQLVGGIIIPLDTTMILLAGTQMTAAWLIPAIVSVVGISLVLARKF